LVEKLRHWASSYNAWVTILDDKGKPNNGPFEASRTIITLHPTTRKPTEHFDFFLYGHFMKFIQRGAVRVASTAPTRNLATVAFRNPDQQLVLVVVNAGGQARLLQLSWNRRVVSSKLPGKSVATFVWPPL
jgi:O-glycosyl hydrolase